MRISDWSSDVCSSDLPDAVAEIVRPDLLARIIVVERQHHVFGWMPLQRDAAVDAFVLGVDLRGAIFLFEEDGDRFVREFRIGARRCTLARRVIAALTELGSAPV